MIVVRVELHSAITGKITEIARAHICNIGGTRARGNYSVEAFRGRDKAALDKRSVCHTGTVTNHARLQEHVWNLVAKALKACGYDQ